MTEMRFNKTGDHEYDVYFCDINVGWVYQDPDAWSYASWFIGGISQDFEAGGVNNKTVKAYGYGTRQRAAGKLIRMQSSYIIRNMP